MTKISLLRRPQPVAPHLPRRSLNYHMCSRMRDLNSRSQQKVKHQVLLHQTTISCGTRNKQANLFEQTYTVPEFIAKCNPNACGGFLRKCFSCRKCFQEQNLSVGPNVVPINNKQYRGRQQSVFKSSPCLAEQFVCDDSST